MVEIQTSLLFHSSNIAPSFSFRLKLYLNCWPRLPSTVDFLLGPDEQGAEGLGSALLCCVCFASRVAEKTQEGRKTLGDFCWPRLFFLHPTHEGSTKSFATGRGNGEERRNLVNRRANEKNGSHGRHWKRENHLKWRKTGKKREGNKSGRCLFFFSFFILVLLYIKWVRNG